MLRLIIVFLIFTGGVYWGSLMAQYEPQKDDLDVQLEQFEEEIKKQEIEVTELKHDAHEHPVEKIASFLEKIVLYLYEKFITLLFWLSNALFSHL